jgi:hypothetical protein
MTSIPAWNGAGFLPPWASTAGPAAQGARSPYRSTMLDFVRRFAITDARIIICQGLLDYRAELRTLGVRGFQWLDGSFVEDVENFRPLKPQPADIDVVTFANFAQQHTTQLDDLSRRSKGRHHVDGYFVSLLDRPENIVEWTAYWFGLFSHRRADAAWKGMVQVDLGTSDQDSVQHLQSLQNAPTP